MTMQETRIDSETIEEVVRAVFSTTLQLDCENCEDEREEGQVRSTVRISGAWNGHIAVAMRHPLASAAASRMFKIEPKEVSADDVLDAVGEISNQVAGSIKAVLAPPCSLDVPRSEAPPEGLTQDPQGSTTYWFETDGEAFKVVVSPA